MEHKTNNSPTGSDAPKTDEKLLSDTNWLVVEFWLPADPLNPKFRIIFSVYCLLKLTARKYPIPFPIHILLPPVTGATDCAGGAGEPNISANGLPNCSRSSDAFDEYADWFGSVGKLPPPNRSTMLAWVAGGDERNGLLTAAMPEVGEVSFVCCVHLGNGNVWSERMSSTFDMNR